MKALSLTDAAFDGRETPLQPPRDKLLGASLIPRSETP